MFPNETTDDNPVWGIFSWSPSSLSAGVTVASPPYGVHSPTDAVEQTQIVEMPENVGAVIHPKTTQVADEPLSDIIMDTQPATLAQTNLIETQTTVVTEVASESSQLEVAPVVQQPLEPAQSVVTQVVAEEEFVEKPARDMEINENYEEGDLNGVF